MVKTPPAIRPGFDLWVTKIPWRRERLPTPLVLPGEFHRQNSLAGYSPRDCKESDTTEQQTHTEQSSVILLFVFHSFFQFESHEWQQSDVPRSFILLTNACEAPLGCPENSVSLLTVWNRPPPHLPRGLVEGFGRMGLCGNRGRGQGSPARVSLVPDRPQPGGEQLSCLEKSSLLSALSQGKKKNAFLFQVGRENLYETNMSVCMFIAKTCQSHSIFSF